MRCRTIRRKTSADEPTKTIRKRRQTGRSVGQGDHTNPGVANGIAKQIVQTDIQIRVLAKAIGDVLTEPLTLQQLADYFEVEKKKAKLILANIGDAAERLDRVTWRIPLAKMPPAYWLERGLILPAGPEAPNPAARSRAA